MSQQKQLKIGKYELLEKIGEGGFGIVYRGRDPLLNRQVAVKILKGDAASAPDFVERFRREARLAAALRHPNIVNVIEVGENDGRYFLVMDLLPGGTLSHLLTKGNPLPLRRVIGLLEPIADALDYAHKKGMIHRDVKPSNIILNEDGQPVLTDFGLGKSLDEGGGTTTGLALGTAEYMAPEQILGRTAGPATDLYALGVIAYQMLTGQLPFSGSTPFTIQKGHAEQTPPDPRQVNPALGEELAGILFKSLNKITETRYQSGLEFITALKLSAAREEEKYWEGLYREANTLMEQGKFAAALQKWEVLQEAHPNYRDVLSRVELCRKKVELQERYEKLSRTLHDAKQEAREILGIDNNFPDSQGIFKIFGLRPGTAADEKVRPVSPVDKRSPETETSHNPVVTSGLPQWAVRGIYWVGVLDLFLITFGTSLAYGIVLLLVEIGFLFLAFFVTASYRKDATTDPNRKARRLSIFGIGLKIFILFITIFGNVNFLPMIIGMITGTAMVIYGIHLWNKKAKI